MQILREKMEKRKQKNKMKKKKLRDKKNDCESNYKWLSNWGWWHTKKQRIDNFIWLIIFICICDIFIMFRRFYIFVCYYFLFFFFFFFAKLTIICCEFTVLYQVFTSEMHRSLTKPTSSYIIWNQFIKPRSWMNEGQIMCLFL